MPLGHLVIFQLALQLQETVAIFFENPSLSQSKLSFSGILPLKISIFKSLSVFPLPRVPNKLQIAPDRLIGSQFCAKRV